MSNTSMIVTPVDPLITTITFIQLCIGRYLYPFIFLTGNIGSILNILILTQPVYLQSSCSCYILASSITNLLIVNIVIFFHFLTFGFGIDLTATSLFFCRFRVYLSHITTMLSRFYIVLACIDRWAMSSVSVQLRAFSHIKVARRLIPIVGTIWCLISLHIPLNYQIINGRCIVAWFNYSIFYNIYNTILAGFLTPILMITFGFLTIRNIRFSRRRVNIQVPANLQRGKAIYRRSREYDILLMILVQLAVYLITCLPFPIFLVYSTVTMQWNKSNVQVVLDQLYSTVAYMLANINFSATFYIYILTTRIFRKELRRLMKHYCCIP